MHQDEKMYVPTMIFGHLLTSSNFDDNDQKVTGGRNGFGAKLCNVFSNKFTVETSCKEYKKEFKQTWTNNMSKANDAKIKPAAEKDFTRITYYPDLSKFNMTSIDRVSYENFKRLRPRKRMKKGLKEYSCITLQLHIILFSRILSHCYLGEHTILQLLPLVL